MPRCDYKIYTPRNTIYSRSIVGPCLDCPEDVRYMDGSWYACICGSCPPMHRECYEGNGRVYSTQLKMFDIAASH